MKFMRLLQKRPSKKMSPYIFLCAVFFSSAAYGDSLSFTMAIQNEAFTADTGESISRIALGAVGAAYEMNFSRKVGMGIFGGAQTSLVSQENLSFGLGGFFNYYFKGSPIQSEFETNSAYLNGLGRTSYFVGFGIEERFLKSEELDSEIRGGPFFRGGGRYIWNSRTFFTADLKYLLGGADYSSIDLNLGIGFFL